jgi:prefoldin subunit 5
MTLPALKLEMEITVEESVGRLEANVEHIQKDVGDMKIDIRRLNDKVDSVDAKLLGRIDSLDKRLTDKIDSVKDSVTALAINMEKQFANVEKQFAQVQQQFAVVEKSFGVLHAARAFDRVWWLLMSAALLGIMARAFKWI